MDSFHATALIDLQQMEVDFEIKNSLETIKNFREDEGDDLMDT